MGCGGGRQQEQAQAQRARRTGRERGSRLLSGCRITPNVLPVNTLGSKAITPSTHILLHVLLLLKVHDVCGGRINTRTSADTAAQPAGALG